jgi:predicted lipoprotein with Yx(FWY)xxD motif
VNRQVTGGVVKVMNTATRPGAGLRQLLRVAGAGLLIATAAIHLDLYLTGYRTIPTIGWLFLLQVITGFLLAALVLATGNRLVAAAGAGFALSTLGGYLLSVQFGLFGFKEVRTTAGIVAGLLEVAAFAALAGLAAMPSRQAAARTARAAADSSGPGETQGQLTGPYKRRRVAGTAQADALPGAAFRGTRRPAGRSAMTSRYAAPAVAGISVVALALLGGALSGAGHSAGTTPAAGAALRTASIGGTTVLTDAQGRTLYWFAPDTRTTSACYGTCAQYWPPVAGPDHAGTGVTGTLGTITRTGGSLQETYDGHPLYTYVGDTAPGQAHGNNVDLNGGFWHEIVVSQ